MKKIVSTMFKYGAICASINTTLADDEPQVSVNEQPKSRIVDTGAATIPSKQDRENPDSFWKEFSQDEADKKRGESEKELFYNVKPLTTEGTISLKTMLERKGAQFTETDKQNILRALTEAVLRAQSFEFGNYDLHPDCIMISPLYEVKFFKVNNPSSLDKQHQMMLVYQAPQQAFAYLILYVMCPELRNLFDKGQLWLEESGALLCLSGKQVKQYNVEQNPFHKYIQKAQELFSGRVTMEFILDLLNNPLLYTAIEKELIASIYAYDLNDRKKARETLESYGKTLLEFFIKGDERLWLLSRLLRSAEDGDKETFLKLASGCSKLVDLLEDLCSTEPKTACVKKRGICVSQNTLGIILSYKE